MEINKNNYEAFFLDYHEGTLSPEQVAELLLFVEQHPELRMEFESFENITLDEFESASFDAKDSIKKEIIITSANVEEYMIRSIEGQLNTLETKELHAYISGKPELLKTFALYNSTILEAAEDIRFEDKDLLKRYAPASDDILIAYTEGLLSPTEQNLLESQAAVDAKLAHDISLYRQTYVKPDLSVVYPDHSDLRRNERKVIPFFYYVAAAAAIILLFGLAIMFRFNNTDSGTPEFAKNEKTSPVPAAVVQQQIPVAAQSNDKLAAADNNELKEAKATDQNDQKSRTKTNNNRNITVPNEQREPQLAKNETQVLIRDTVIFPQQPAPQIAYAEPRRNESPDLVKPQQESQYLSLAQMAAEKLKQKTLDPETIAQQTKAGKMKRLTGWDVMQIVAKGVSRVTGQDVGVKPTYNEEGEVTAYAFNAGKLGFSRDR
jgi:hypothetical protein